MTITDTESILYGEARAPTPDACYQSDDGRRTYYDPDGLIRKIFVPEDESFSHTPSATDFIGECTIYFDSNYRFHREHAPAVEYADGSVEYWAHGKKHRDHDPAIEYADGGVQYWNRGKLHRTDGPAIENERVQEWWVRGQRHRVDGPAVKWADEEEMYFLENNRVPDADWPQVQRNYLTYTGSQS